MSMYRKQMLPITFLLVLMFSGGFCQPPENWQVNAHDFEYFMTITASVVRSPSITVSAEDVLAAFTNGECRGTVQPNLVDGEWVFFLMVRSNTPGESVQFQYWQAPGDLLIASSLVLPFSIGESYGEVDNPYELWLEPEVSILPALEEIKMFHLEPNFPNPFNPSTLIRYSLQEAGRAELTIYDVNGSVVVKLVDAWLEAGTYACRWLGTDFRGLRISSGIYLCVMQSGSNQQKIKLTLLH